MLIGMTLTHTYRRDCFYDWRYERRETLRLVETAVDNRPQSQSQRDLSGRSLPEHARLCGRTM